MTELLTPFLNMVVMLVFPVGCLLYINKISKQLREAQVRLVKAEMTISILTDEIKIQQNSITEMEECYLLLKKRIELDEEIEKVAKAPKVAKKPIKTHDADIKSRIVEALGQSPEGLSMNRLSKRTGSAMRTIKRHTQIMEKEGMLSLESTKGLTLVRLKGGENENL